MKNRPRIIFVILGILVLSFFAYASGFTDSGDDPSFGMSTGPKTLIVTTDREEFAEPFTTKIAVWLRAVFSVEVQVVTQNKLVGEDLASILDGSDVIIYYGLDYDRPPPQGFIDYSFRLVEAGAARLVWIGCHGDKLRGYLELYGMSYGGVMINDSPPAQVLYVDTSTNYDILNQHLFLLQFSSLQSGLSRARATVGGKPVVLSGRHGERFQDGPGFYFFGFHPTSYLARGGAHLIFLDLMHEVYGIRRDKHALLRLEDVSAVTSPEQLLEISRYLGETGRPFTISLIPFYLGSDGRLTPLREEVDLLEAIGISLEHGGEIVIHGATHQYKGITGVDSEFWDEEREAPIDDINYVRSRVQLALAEIKANGFLDKVVGWETPHYRAGEMGYAFFEGQFDLIYEEPHWNYDLQFLPYPIIRTDSVYIPTNLGYYHGGLSNQIGTKLEQAAKVFGLQYGGVVSFFYHPWLGVEKLKLWINGLTEQGWEFSLASSVASEYSTTGSGG